MLCMDCGKYSWCIRAYKKWFIFISTIFFLNLITAAHASLRGATFFLVSNYCCKKLNIKSAEGKNYIILWQSGHCQKKGQFSPTFATDYYIFVSESSSKVHVTLLF